MKQALPCYCRNNQVAKEMSWVARTINPLEKSQPKIMTRMAFSVVGSFKKMSTTE
jgi:hypothetical protein